MEHARRQGFPVPVVHDAGDRDLVLERLEGPTMLADLAHRPWLVRRHGRTLAELHRRLHEIPAPQGLRAPFDRGVQLVHFDLHPGNVILTARGPVVIDWTDACRSEAADDVAQTWVILSTSAISGPLPFRALGRVGRDLFVDAFLAGVDAADARERVKTMAERRLRSDPHLLDGERVALRALIS
jgi:tRNA A-37 threonylcarbamoyl transferase component Bud32